jgi:hypothetical protein
MGLTEKRLRELAERAALGLKFIGQEHCPPFEFSSIEEGVGGTGGARLEVYRPRTLSALRVFVDRGRPPHRRGGGCQLAAEVWKQAALILSKTTITEG